MQRINLYPSPLTPLVNDGTGDITHGDYDVAIDNLEAGTYVFAADIQNSGTQTGINVMLFDSGWNPIFSSDKIGHVQTTFTLKKPDRVRIRAFQAGVTISNVIVERADTYALTSGGGLPGLLLQGYGAVLSLSRVVGVFLLVLVSNGGWRHEGTELCSQTAGRDHLVKTNRHEYMGHPWIRQVDADERIHPQMRRDIGRAARHNPNRMESDTVPGIATDRRQHLQQGLLATARDFRDPVRHVDHDAPARHTGTGGCDHTCHRPGLFRRRHRTLLNGLGVAA